jgi:hypothetical protein
MDVMFMECFVPHGMNICMDQYSTTSSWMKVGNGWRLWVKVGQQPWVAKVYVGYFSKFMHINWRGCSWSSTLGKPTTYNFECTFSHSTFTIGIYWPSKFQSKAMPIFHKCVS